MSAAKRNATPKKRKPPFSLRLTDDECARLEAQAGSMPLSSYVKSVVLADDAPTYRKRKSLPEADQRLLAEILMRLGASRSASNLNQIAKHLESGNDHRSTQRARGLEAKQKQRWDAESKHRMRRLNKGLLGLFDRISGSHKSTRRKNEREAMVCARRDQQQRDRLIVTQMLDRRALQQRVGDLKQTQKAKRDVIAKTVWEYMARASKTGQMADKSKQRTQSPAMDR